MEPIERYLLKLMLALAIMTYAIIGVVSTASSPIEASISAGVPCTPVVLRVRFELGRVGFTVAVLAQLRQEPSDNSPRPDVAELTASNDERTFAPAVCPRGSHGLMVSEWHEERKLNKSFHRLSAAGGQIVHRLLGE